MLITNNSSIIQIVLNETFSKGIFFQDDFPTNIVKGKICTMTKGRVRGKIIKTYRMSQKLGIKN